MEMFERVYETYKYDLMSKQNVIGVGIGYKFKENTKTKHIGIVTLVTKKVPKALLANNDRIPKNLKGILTDVWETGLLKPFQKRREVLRPAQPGCSIGHYRSPGAGTLGAIVKDVRGKKLMLSNNHILADLTNGKDNRSKIGDSILQPGVLDGGTEKNRIGFLKTFIPVPYGNDENNPCLLDVALAQPDDEKLIERKILNIGLVTGFAEASLGDTVFKSGRGSGLTLGEVIAKKVMLRINYGEQLDVEAVFDDQILASTGAYPGDSGSILVSTEKRKAVGILLGGGGYIDVYNNFTNVVRILGINI